MITSSILEIAGKLVSVDCKTSSVCKANMTYHTNRGGLCFPFLNESPSSSASKLSIWFSKSLTCKHNPKVNQKCCTDIQQIKHIIIAQKTKWWLCARCKVRINMIKILINISRVKYDASDTFRVVRSKKLAIKIRICLMKFLLHTK
jgi:hypothetical protein